MINVQIDIQDAVANQLLRDITRGLTHREELNQNVAIGVKELVRGNLIRNYTGRTRHGNFWQRVVNSIETQSSATEASVSLVELGIGLRYNGGEVRPGKNAASAGPNKGQLTRALAVPSDAVPVVSGRQKTPDTMGLLAFLRAKVRGGDTIGYLVEGMEKTRTKSTRKGAIGSKYVVPLPGGSLLYTLRRVTRHTADPNIIPPIADINEAALSAARGYLASFE